MAKRRYGIIKAKKLEFPQIDLLRVPHKKGILTVVHPAFGSNYFEANVAKMQQDYSHPQTGKRISFREPTTSESISAAAYDFKNLAKLKILIPNLQTGYIVRTSEGVFANPPKDNQRIPIIDEKILEFYLNKSEKINGIYLGENDFGFAPHETFEMGTQDSNVFAQGGLARVLEHTSKEQAKNLKEITSKNHLGSVDVCGFREIKEPVLNLVGLYSFKDVGGNLLFFHCAHPGDFDRGFSFGVLDESAKGASEK